MTLPAGEAIRVSHAVKNFGATQALRDVSLSLRTSEWLGLLGPNGAGKTTLLRAICGQVKLTGGTIDVFGVPRPQSGGATPQDRKLGVVPQSVALFPLLTARENLQVFGGLYGLQARELDERVAWALDWSGLGNRADAQVRGFSGGMMRRLNMACSMLHRPGIVLLDEPTVGVDPQSRQRIFEMLHEVQAGGAAVIHATNQLEDAERYCDRIVILDNGVIVADGRLDELVARTLGGMHRIDVTLSRPLPPSQLPAGFAASGRQISGWLGDIEADLQNLLSVLRDAGIQVVDLRVEAPRLQAVFLKLTGRELRD